MRLLREVSGIFNRRIAEAYLGGLPYCGALCILNSPTWLSKFIFVLEVQHLIGYHPLDDTSYQESRSPRVL